MKKYIIYSFLLIFTALALLHTGTVSWARGILSLTENAFSSRDKPAEKIYRVETGEKMVALSFDDGPDSRFTPEVLKILESYGVKATFFVVGSQAEKKPGLALEIDRQGHELANHTWTHPQMKELDPGQLLSEVASTNLLINRLTGKQNNYFRPPRGELTPGDQADLQRLGFTIVMWAVCLENSQAVTPGQMSARVLKNIAPGEIILLHDGLLDRTKTVQALPLLLEGLKDKGYRAVTVGELLQLKN